MHFELLTTLCINYALIKLKLKKIYAIIYGKYLRQCLACGKVSINSSSSQSSSSTNKKQRSGILAR